MANLSDRYTSINATSAIKLPSGTTAQRPAGAAGDVRYNTDNNEFEGYDGSAWGSLGGGLVPTPITTNTTAAAGNFYLVDTSGGDVTITLPNISNERESIGILVVDATNSVIVNADASDTIEGATTFTLSTERDWRVLLAQSTSNWSAQRPSSGSGVIVTDWESYSPTAGGGWGTLSGQNLEWRRVGDSIEIRGYFTLGTVSASEAQLPLPNGWTVGGPNSADTILCGMLQPDVARDDTFLLLATKGDAFLNFSLGIQTGSSPNSLIPTNGNDGLLTGERVAITTTTIPITELTNSGTTVTLQDLTARTKWVDESVCSVSNSNGGTVAHARFLCTKDSAGAYLLEYNISITGASSSTSHTITLGLGTTFLYSDPGAQAAATEGGFAKTTTGAATIQQLTDVAVGAVDISGRALLTDKPSWFDANVENAQSIDAQITDLNMTGDLTVSGQVGIGTSTFDGALTIKPSSNSAQLKLEQDNVADGYKLFCDSNSGDLIFQRDSGGSDTTRVTFAEEGAITVKPSSNLPQIILEQDNHATDNWVLHCTSAGGNLDFKRNTSTTHASFYGDGRVYFSQTSWGTGGTAVGISSNLLTTSPSSMRYKENIKPLSTEVDSSLVYALEPVVFDYKQDGRHSFGFIAEQVFPHLPCLVHVENNQPESVAYDHLSVLLLEEIKKLKARIEVLENSN